MLFKAIIGSTNIVRIGPNRTKIEKGHLYWGYVHGTTCVIDLGTVCWARANLNIYKDACLANKNGEKFYSKIRTTEC